MSPRSPAVLAALVLLSVPSAGCGPDDAGGEAGRTITYGSLGTTADIDCGDRTSLTIGGSNNTLKVTGTCASVSVGGADNAITVDRIDGTLSVVGLNNTVTYRSGDPDVDDQGSGNRISKG